LLTLQVTILGLDFGIPAEMTVIFCSFPSWSFTAIKPSKSGAYFCVAPDIRFSGNGGDVARPTGLTPPFEKGGQGGF